MSGERMTRRNRCRTHCPLMAIPHRNGRGLRPPVPPIGSTSLCGIVISHPHQDHYGLLPWMPKAVPVAMGAAAKRILKAAAPYTKHPVINLDGPDLLDRQPVNLGPFRITPYLVDHSAYDAYALLIEVEGKRLFYSGDLRMHGRKTRLMDRLMAECPKDVDVLMLEGTTLGRSNSSSNSLSEGDLEECFADTFNKTAGLALLQVSAQNIDRMTSASDLRDEAWAMSHCVGRNYPTWCKEGFIRVFSIRDIDGRRKATASLVFDYERNRWCVEQCKG